MKLEKQIKLLLEFVSESERNVFDRMYPDGVSAIENKKHALRQIKTTLSQRTDRFVSQAETIKSQNLRLDEKTTELYECQKKCKELERELVDAKYTPQELDEDDALLLSALQHAGVDNWDGYDYAMELYEEYKKESV